MDQSITRRGQPCWYKVVGIARLIQRAYVHLKDRRDASRLASDTTLSAPTEC